MTTPMHVAKENVPAKATLKKGSFLGIGFTLLAGLCCISLVVVGGVGFWFLRGRTDNIPFVLINAPHAGEQVQVGRSVFIDALGRDPSGVTRMELWVDGTLQDVSRDAPPADETGMVFSASWNPTAAGAHNIMVRAFNTAGRYAHSSVRVDARGMEERCPPGMVPGASGCIPQEEADPDGDGLAGLMDACPDEAGTAELSGCPPEGDADGDGVRTGEDACPTVPGDPAAAGCPDDDGDGLHNAEDACPAEAGPAGAEGCPDRDGDGVRDLHDLCPDVPGEADNAGCPRSGAGDSDGDGIADDVDLDADEPGGRESGGAPLPGEGTDADGDGIPDDGLAGEDAGGLPPPETGETIPVQIEVISFTAGDAEGASRYDGVYCYASIAGGDVERLPADADYFEYEGLGTAWDMEHDLGGEHSRTVNLEEGQPFTAHLECSAVQLGAEVGGDDGDGIGEGGGSEAYFDLGATDISHGPEEWDARELHADATDFPDIDRRFGIDYRLCTPSCTEITLPAPVLRLVDSLDGPLLFWTYPGDIEDIDGYKLYVNGASVYPFITRGVDRFRLSPLSPTGDARHPGCGESYQYELTAFNGYNSATHETLDESPRSNMIPWTASPETADVCPLRARIELERLVIPDMPMSDQGSTGSWGPISGRFYVYGSSGMTDRLSFMGGACPGLFPFECYGFRVSPNRSYDILTIFEWIYHAYGDSCHTSPGGVTICEEYEFPEPLTNVLEVNLAPRDRLQFFADIVEEDTALESPSTLLDITERIPFDAIHSGDRRTITDPDSGISLEIRIRLLETE